LDWSPRTARGARRDSRTRRGASPRQPETSELTAFAITDPVESYCMSVLLRRPDLVYRVDRALQESGLNRLSLDDFQSAEHQLLLQLIEDSLNQDHAEPLHFVLNSLSLPLMELVDQLLQKSGDLDPVEDRVLEDLVRSILMLRQRRLRQQMDHVRYLMEEAQLTGQSQANEYQQAMVQYILARGRLDQALGRYTSHSNPRIKTNQQGKPGASTGER
jgi:hypothetical protein